MLKEMHKKTRIDFEGKLAKYEKFEEDIKELKRVYNILPGCESRLQLTVNLPELDKPTL